MDPEKERALFDKYSALTPPAGDSWTTPIDLFGLEVGDGWYDVLDRCFSRIQESGEDVQIVQVKEKFGGIRIYTTPLNSDGVAASAIDDAEKEAYRTCEFCGATDYVTKGALPGGHWIKTACAKCRQSPRS